MKTVFCLYLAQEPIIHGTHVSVHLSITLSDYLFLYDNIAYSLRQQKQYRPWKADNRYVPDKVNKDRISLWVKGEPVGQQHSIKVSQLRHQAALWTVPTWTRLCMAPVELERQGNQCKLEANTACCAMSYLATNIKMQEVNLLICKQGRISGSSQFLKLKNNVSFGK